MKFLLGRKEYMTQIFTEEGEQQPVTVFLALPVVVTQIKTLEKDGYRAVQVGAGRKKAKNATQPERGHMSAGLAAIDEDPAKVSFQLLKEFRYDDDTPFSVGDQIDVSIFEVGEKVAVSGKSKGKGFQGGVKRHNFAGKNASHGTKHAHREVGSIGATGPQRVFKGRKMPGRMGYDRVTVKNLKVAYIDPENNMIALKGAVPGKTGDMIEIRANA